MIDEKKLISHIENQYREWGEEYDAEQILGDIEDFPKADSTMTNLEFYKDEIKKRIKNGENFGCVICKAKNKNCPQCSADDGDDILCNVVDWLSEEYKEPIKLKQWEKDLLKSFGDTASHHKFDYFPSLREMKHMGYFESVKDTSMELGDILGNCEVFK